MKTEIVRLEDTGGTSWRLALDEDPERSHPLVVLEQLDTAVVDGWVHIRHVTENPELIGVRWRVRGIMAIDSRLARESLEIAMAPFKAVAKAPSSGGISDIEHSAPSTPVMLEDQKLEGHEFTHLLNYVMDLELTAGNATRGFWFAERPAPAESISGAALEAVITGSPTDPVAESMSSADARHVIRTQPIAAAALARKLREAFYLMQDLSRALQAARAEIDQLLAPVHRTPQYTTRIGMFDRWLSYLGERCAAFLVIQAPSVDQRGPLASDAPKPPEELTRLELLKIARFEAFRQGYSGSHAYLPKTGDEAQSFTPDDWVIWAMSTAVERALERVRR